MKRLITIIALAALTLSPAMASAGITHKRADQMPHPIHRDHFTRVLPPYNPYGPYWPGYPCTKRSFWPGFDKPTHWRDGSIRPVPNPNPHETGLL